jgi:hypothetical protein
MNIWTRPAVPTRLRAAAGRRSGLVLLIVGAAAIVAVLGSTAPGMLTRGSGGDPCGVAPVGTARLEQAEPLAAWSGPHETV